MINEDQAPSQHISRARMREFVDATLDSGSRRKVLSHLLSGCSECQGVARQFWAGPKESAPEPEISAVPALGVDSWQRLIGTAQELAARLETEREIASALWQELEPHPVERRRMMVVNSRRFQTWGLCEHLLDASWDSRFDDADATLGLASLAGEVAERLDPKEYGDACYDLQARCVAHVGNAHRIKADFQAADTSFVEAKRLLATGTGDPLELATVLRFETTLRNRQNRYDEALTLCERQVSICRRFGRRHRLGEAIMARGMVRASRDEDELAIRDYELALDYLDAETDARIVLTCRHNLVLLHLGLGNHEDARLRLEELRPVYFDLGDRLNLLRLKNVEGNIARATGDDGTCEACWVEACNGMIANDLPWDAAILSLKLAELYLEQGRTAETRSLAEKILPIFQSRELHTEAIAAMLLFREAAISQSITVTMVQETIRFVRALQERSQR